MKSIQIPSRKFISLVLSTLILIGLAAKTQAAELPLVRIAHGAFSEKAISA
jgi:hypothetical protein